MLELLLAGLVAAAATGRWAVPRVATAIRDGRPPGWGPLGALLPCLAVLSVAGVAALQVARDGFSTVRPGAYLHLEQAFGFVFAALGPAVGLLLVRAYLAAGRRDSARWARIGAIAALAWLATAALLAAPLVGSPLGRAVRQGWSGPVRLLLDLGFDPERPDRWDRRTPLGAAVLRRDREIVELLLARGADVNGPDPDGARPVHYACWQGDRPMAELLLARGADATRPDRGGLTPLMIAATRRDAETALVAYRYLPQPHPLEKALLAALRAGNPDPAGELLWRLVRRNVLTGEEWRRELLRAAGEGRVAGVGEALEAGAGADCVDELGASALLLASRAGAAEAAVRLLEAGACPDLADVNGLTPLSAAAAGGHTEVVRVLLDRGAPPNQRDAGGRTALMAAAGAGHVDVLALLLDRGADASLTTSRDGETARSLARLGGHPAAEALLAARGAPDRAPDPPDESGSPRAALERLVERSETGQRRELLRAIGAGDLAAVERLVRAGADPNGRDPATNGGTALTWAAYCGRPEVARLLLDFGAEVDGASDAGVTPLHEAAKAGSAPLALLLLDRGANVDARTRSGWTPLLWASERGHANVVRLLLERGASVDASDRAGRTPLSVARASRHDEVVRILSEGGTKARRSTRPAGGRR